MTDKPLIQRAREERSYYVQKSAWAKPSEAAVDAGRKPHTGEHYLLYVYRCPQCGFRTDLPPGVDPPVCPRCGIQCQKSRRR